MTDYHKDGLIIGTSRAAQAIEPSCFDNRLYNFAFTVQLSPFDSTYFKLIQKYHPKVAYDSSRLHIISVDPWALWTYKNQAEEMLNPAFEQLLEAPVQNPNYQYIYHFVPVLKSLTTVLATDKHVNAGGRYVVPIDSLSLIDREKSMEGKVASYKKKKEYTEGYLSEKRLRILKQIIDYLSQDGKVVLVRLPVHEKMYVIENNMAPKFDEQMQSISRQKRLPYINLMPLRNDYLYTDGNHIWDGQSSKISWEIRKSMRKMED
jgi:hypothetical protein